MEKISEYLSVLSEIVHSLGQDQMSRLDFDRMSADLMTAIDLLSQADEELRGFKTLRQDYIGRISGMEKAIAIASRRDGSLDNALTIIESLESLSAEELIRQYARTQARFRDAFPASFGLLPSSGKIARMQIIAEYK